MKVIFFICVLQSKFCWYYNIIITVHFYIYRAIIWNKDVCFYLYPTDTGLVQSPGSLADPIVIHPSSPGKKPKPHLLHCNVSSKHCDIYLGFKLFLLWRLFLWKKGVTVTHAVEASRSNHLSPHLVSTFKGEALKVATWKAGFFLA